MLKINRLTRELAKIKANPIKGISVFEKETKLDNLDVKIFGPNGTPYEGGIFTIEVLVPDNYPFAPPSMKFVTKIYHPNIDNDGRICLDLIKTPPGGSWKPTIGLDNLFIAIRSLLESPNPDDPLMADIANEFKSNRKEFERKAKEYCRKYANH